MAKRTHIPRYPDKDLTLCGREAAKVTLIGRNEIVDMATCKACWRADDALQVRDHERARKAAGKKLGEWF